MSDEPIINHDEAKELAAYNAPNSNLARCYLDLVSRLHAVINERDEARRLAKNRREIVRQKKRALEDQHHNFKALTARLSDAEDAVNVWRKEAEQNASRLGALLKAAEFDIADAKHVCGGDGEGCDAYRGYYDSAARRHRKCGSCPMGALSHIREAWPVWFVTE